MFIGDNVSQKIIQFGFDIHIDMSLDQIVYALRFCPIQYEVEQLNSQYFFFKVEESQQKVLILNFLSDFKLRKELNEQISLEEKSFVDAIIMASISK